MYIPYSVPFCLLLLFAVLPINSGCKNPHTVKTDNRNAKPSIRTIIQSDKDEESLIKVL